jgi:uncharacterized membrane protein
MFSQLHSVCVETAPWISEQKTTLSAVFYLAAARAYLHFDQTRRRSHYFLALALFVLALLSRTVTSTLPAALLVVLWWRRKHLSCRRDALPLLPWFALGGACYRVAGATIYSRGGSQFRPDAGRAAPVSRPSDLVLPGLLASDRRAISPQRETRSGV